MAIEEQIEHALNSPEPFQQLRSLAARMLHEGYARTAVVEHFEEARQRLRQADREAEEDVVMDVMDCLVGWCSPHMKLLAAADGSSQHVGPG
ncbi:MAG: hypothetical protein ACP5XB_20870 [Isosphaeraceae bacterium]